MKKVFFFGFFFLFFIGFVGAQSACSNAPPCGTLLSDGCALTSSVNLYQDFNLPNGINICAPNVTLDCQGHTLTGSFNGTFYYGGLLSTNVSGVSIFSEDAVVRNCNINDYPFGIRGYANNSVIANNRLNYHEFGVYFDLLTERLKNIEIIDNRVANTRKTAITVGRSNDVVIARNEVLNVSSDASDYFEGIRLWDNTVSFVPHNAVIEDNYVNISGMYSTNIYMGLYARNVTIRGNELSGGWNALIIGDSLAAYNVTFGIYVYDNDIHDSGTGIRLVSGTDLRVERNRLYDNIAGLYLLTFIFSPQENLVFRDNYLDNIAFNVNIYPAAQFTINLSSLSRGRNIVGGPFVAGNYYGNYAGVDDDGDGIGDTPYVLNTFVDPYPLVTTPAIVVDGNPSPGSVINFSLYTKPNTEYALGLSTADSPPIVLPDGRVVPLYYDSLLNTCLTNPESIGLVNSQGFTDSTGFAQVSIAIPNQPSLLNQSAYVGYVTVNSTGGIDEISPSVRVDVV